MRGNSQPHFTALKLVKQRQLFFFLSPSELYIRFRFQFHKRHLHETLIVTVQLLSDWLNEPDSLLNRIWIWCIGIVQHFWPSSRIDTFCFQSICIVQFSDYLPKWLPGQLSFSCSPSAALEPTSFCRLAPILQNTLLGEVAGLAGQN